MSHIAPEDYYCYYCKLKLLNSSHQSLGYHPDCQTSIVKYNSKKNNSFTYYCDYLLPKNQVTFLLEFETMIRALQPEHLVDNKLQIFDSDLFIIPPDIPLYISKNSDGINSILLYSIPLTHLPASLKYLSTLESLTLTDTKLLIFPDVIFQLKNLQSLSLERNLINNIPYKIGTLKKLANLCITGTNITSLPASIGNLSQLSSLFLNFNKLESLPDSLINLVNLDILSVYSNKFKSVPKPIFTFNRRSTLVLLRSITKEGIIPEDDWLSVINMEI